MNNIYEVERDDYVGFLDQLRPDARNIRQEHNEGVTWIKTFSKQYGNLLCTREIYDEGEEHYYIFEMMHDDERQTPKAKRKIRLDTREEVQAFFDILSKISKGENK